MVEGHNGAASGRTVLKILAVIAGNFRGLEDTGTIGEVVEARGGEIDWTFRVRGDALPESAAGYDGLIIFGGEISVYDERLSDYFRELAKTIHAFHAAQKPILGSCLGAQSIAQAFGAKVAPGVFEYGFTPVHKEEAAKIDPLLKDTPATVLLFELHGDAFCIPEGAVRLLRGDVVENQAFRIGNTTYGFQCHFEVSPEIVRVWSDLVWGAGDRSEEREAMIKDALASFAKYGQGQRLFALTVTNAWMDLVVEQAAS